MKIVTRADRRDLRDTAAAVFKERWPEFIFHDEVPKKYLGRAEQYFDRFDIMVLDHDVVVAGGWGVPIPWSGENDVFAVRLRRCSRPSRAGARDGRPGHDVELLGRRCRFGV